RILNRSKQSAVAAAAYRSGEKLYSERDMETKKYRIREVAPESFIMAPGNAPEWVNNREKLWNEVEKIEKNINSQLAREIKVALPLEQSNSVQKELLVDFVQRNFVEKGMVADVSIHRDKKENPHAHIMLTMRPFLDNGQWGNKKKKIYLKDDNGNKILDSKGKPKYRTYSLTDWDKRNNILIWRKDWADTVNRYYEQEGLNERITEKSYVEQGLDKMPKHRLTVEEYRFERAQREKAEKEGKTYKPKSYYAQINKKIEILNKAIELKKQKIVELAEYKQAMDEPDYKKLNKIRDINNLSPDDQAAIRAIGKHMKRFVDLETAEKNMERMQHFKIALEKKYYAANGLDDFLTRTKNIYAKNSKLVRGFGINPATFESDLLLIQRERDQAIDNYMKSKNHFDRDWEQGEKVLEIQKKFVEKEFAYLYPEENDKLNMAFSGNINRDYVLKVKAGYVKQFRQTGKLATKIPEFDPSNRQLLKEYADLQSIQTKLQRVRVDLKVLKRTKDKRKDEYLATVKDQYDKEKVKKAAISYLAAYNHFTDKKKERVKLDTEIDHLVTSIYPKEDQAVVNKLPSNEKLTLVQMHLDGNESGNFKADSKVAHALNERKNAEQEVQMQRIRIQKDTEWKAIRNSLNNSVYRLLSDQERQALETVEKMIGEKPTIGTIEQQLMDAGKRFMEADRQLTGFYRNHPNDYLSNDNAPNLSNLNRRRNKIKDEQIILNTAKEALSKLKKVDDKLDLFERQFKAREQPQVTQEKGQASGKGFIFIEQGLKVLNEAFTAALDEQEKHKRNKKRNKSEVKYRGKDDRDQLDM
ncbi:MAG: Nickase TraA, partial [Sporolactobacillus laevolacticus]|nr:Nickase TraA [Sporolactobacillus laevolacticus]